MCWCLRGSFGFKLFSKLDLERWCQSASCSMGFEPSQRSNGVGQGHCASSSYQAQWLDLSSLLLHFGWVHFTLFISLENFAISLGEASMTLFTIFK